MHRDKAHFNVRDSTEIGDVRVELLFPLGARFPGSNQEVMIYLAALQGSDNQGSCKISNLIGRPKKR